MYNLAVPTHILCATRQDCRRDQARSISKSGKVSGVFLNGEAYDEIGTFTHVAT